MWEGWNLHLQSSKYYKLTHSLFLFILYLTIIGIGCSTTMGIQPEIINANRMSTTMFVIISHKPSYDVQTKSLSCTGTFQKLAILAYNFEPPVVMREEEGVGEGPDSCQKLQMLPYCGLTCHTSVSFRQFKIKILL